MHLIVVHGCVLFSMPNACLILVRAECVYVIVFVCIIVRVYLFLAFCISDTLVLGW